MKWMRLGQAHDETKRKGEEFQSKSDKDTGFGILGKFEHELWFYTPIIYIKVAVLFARERHVVLPLGVS